MTASIDWMNHLLNWILGLATIGIIGIVAMNVQLWVLKARFDAHEETCLEKHEAHEKEDEDLWNEMKSIKGGRNYDRR